MVEVLVVWKNSRAGQRIGQGGVGVCVLAEGYSSPIATLRLLAPCNCPIDGVVPWQHVVRTRRAPRTRASRV